ncbi:MAG TPA: hypothetical protein DEP18_07540 [Flavobacteriales bacterium]|nr:hypothetical protein [Flavobacteriales bacterium]HRE76023.1 hypothetical protein [Flavobacteriales bacterium]HRE98778.1 hypothetical protein [Flavobacteriales bacterium]HRJ34726.1 hypothetical protein [Flavobacteriales bacterium]HRJ39302.1 hypothetical protein [Flavobacteriales bacterium]
MKNYKLLLALVISLFSVSVSAQKDANQPERGYPDFYMELIGIDDPTYPRLGNGVTAPNVEVYLEQVRQWCSANPVKFYQYLENRAANPKFTSVQQRELPDAKALKARSHLRMIEQVILLQRKLNIQFPFVEELAKQKQAVFQVPTKIYLVLIHKDDLDLFFNPEKL